jgi:hypothetical protein
MGAAEISHNRGVEEVSGDSPGREVVEEIQVSVMAFSFEKHF